MKVRGIKKEKNTVYGCLLSLTAMAVVMVIFAIVTANFVGRTGGKKEGTLKKAVTRASVQCYAIEGRYPPSVEYLEENYGVQINCKKYNVSYDDFASNVVPEINVILIEEQGAVE